MQLIEKGINPDTKKYLLLLYASTANLLSFSGYTTKKVYNVIKAASKNPPVTKKQFSCGNFLRAY